MKMKEKRLKEKKTRSWVGPSNYFTGERSQRQQTPNPEAQEPEAVPPSLLQSDEL